MDPKIPKRLKMSSRTYFNVLPIDILSLISLNFRLDQIFALAQKYFIFNELIDNPNFWNCRYYHQFGNSIPSLISNRLAFYGGAKIDRQEKITVSPMEWYYYAHQVILKSMESRSYFHDLGKFISNISITQMNRIKNRDALRSIDYALGLSEMMKLGLAEEAELFILKDPSILNHRITSMVENEFGDIEYKVNRLNEDAHQAAI